MLQDLWALVASQGVITRTATVPVPGFLGVGTGANPAIAAYSNSGSDAFEAYSDKNGFEASLDNSGNLILLGSLTTKGSPQVRTTSTAGKDLTSYV